jgi:hypothetical protein
MLYQLHHQDKADPNKTEMKAAREICSQEELKRFVKETNELFPLPDGMMWLVVPESKVSGDFKPCPACGKPLESPTEYLAAVGKMRKELDGFYPVIIKDFIQNDLSPMLFQLAGSHSKLAQAEYNRNPCYNDTHFSHRAEEAFLKFLKEHDLTNDFLQYDNKDGWK